MVLMGDLLAYEMTPLFKQPSARIDEVAPKAEQF